MKGSVKIKKVFRDGSEELVLEDHNILTKGMGRSITAVLPIPASTNQRLAPISIN
jgi:hypothetical protein